MMNLHTHTHHVCALNTQILSADAASPWRVCVGPDGAAGVAQDRRGEALGHAHEAGSIHLHDQVVDLDPMRGERETALSLCRADA